MPSPTVRFRQFAIALGEVLRLTWRVWVHRTADVIRHGPGWTVRDELGQEQPQTVRSAIGVTDDEWQQVPDHPEVQEGYMQLRCVGLTHAPALSITIDTALTYPDPLPVIDAAARLIVAEGVDALDQGDPRC